MMYKKNLVAAIKVGGKILRETSDRVYLPFGSEYSVLLKNLSSVRMQAKISIDGTDTSNDWFVINPNSSIEIERFVRDNNLKSGNRFKFIERTAAIESHRGIKVEDGLVRVEFKTEKVFEAPKVVEHHTYYHHEYYSWPWYRRYYDYPYVPTFPMPTTTCNSLVSGTQGSSTLHQASMTSTTNVMRSSMKNTMVSSSIANEAGITVPGSESNQKFVTVSDFATEQSEVLVLHLVGCTSTYKVKEPVTVQRKPQCTTCGKANKAASKFCSQCGTALQII